MPIVLIVDDSPVDRRVVGGLLEKCRNMTLQYAGDGAEALAQMELLTPNLVVTDLMMPNVDGLQLVAAVAKKYPRVPIVLMTGQGSEEIASRALRTGASSYVPKRSLAQLLPDTVESLLELSIASQTQEILLGRMVRNDCSFVLENDLLMIPPLVRYLHSCLRSVGSHDDSSGIRVSVALEEALNNAMYHGNLELNSELRENPQVYRETIADRRNRSPYRDRCVYVDAHFTRQDASFTIRDEGPGFDPSTLPDPTDPANLERISGRGVMLMRTFMDQVEYNHSGNSVTLIKRLNGTPQDLAALR